MKINYIALSILLISNLALGQGKETRSQMSARSESVSANKGFVIGLLYSNLTDAYLKTSYAFYRDGVKSEDRSDTNRSGVHVGVMGINLGYKNLYAFGPLGFAAGLQTMRGINGSEIPSAVNIYKVYGDVAWAMTDLIALSIGLNVSHFDGLAQGDVKTEAGIGAQTGIEFRLSGTSLLFGYQTLGLKQKYSDSSTFGGTTYKAEGTTDALISGFITQVSYTF